MTLCIILEDDSCMCTPIQRMLPNSVVRGGDNASRWASLMSGDFHRVIKDLLSEWPVTNLAQYVRGSCQY